MNDGRRFGAADQERAMMTMATHDPAPFDERTMVTRTAEGTHTEAIPGMEVCDFCSSIPVFWVYDTIAEAIELIQRTDPDGQTRHHMSGDPWAACENCHELIDLDARDALLQRTLICFRRQTPEAALIADRVLLAEFGQIQARFFLAKKGPGRPYPHA